MPGLFFLQTPCLSSGYAVALGCYKFGISSFRDFVSLCGTTPVAEVLLAFLNGQRADFGNSLPERLVNIEGLWRQVLSGEKPAEALALLQRCAHSLAGSGATFGFAAVGNAARELEFAVNPFIDFTCTLTASAQTEISRAIALLRCSLPGEAGIPGNLP
jgi:Hpt domain